MSSKRFPGAVTIADPLTISSRLVPVLHQNVRDVPVLMFQIETHLAICHLSAQTVEMIMFRLASLALN